MDSVKLEILTAAFSRVALEDIVSALYAGWIICVVCAVVIDSSQAVIGIILISSSAVFLVFLLPDEVKPFGIGVFIICDCRCVQLCEIFFSAADFAPVVFMLNSINSKHST